jgi:hypothetical protein
MKNVSRVSNTLKCNHGLAIFIHFSVYLQICFLCMIIKSQKLHVPLSLSGMY